ncbi:MAG: SprB repeat-containing protein, partial [Alphaproteobacteria bacterium]
MVWALVYLPPISEITLIKDSTNIACFAGSTGIATVIASGGSGNYTYQWD